MPTRSIITVVICSFSKCCCSVLIISWSHYSDKEWHCSYYNKSLCTYPPFHLISSTFISSLHLHAFSMLLFSLSLKLVTWFAHFFITVNMFAGTVWQQCQCSSAHGGCASNHHWHCCYWDWCPQDPLLPLWFVHLANAVVLCCLQVEVIIVVKSDIEVATITNLAILLCFI